MKCMEIKVQSGWSCHCFEQALYRMQYIIKEIKN